MADVIIVGAGAAGLQAAAFAAERGRSVVLLEKNARPGLKILISGGGRCNLTTTRDGRDRALYVAGVDAPEYRRRVLQRFGLRRPALHDVG